MIKIISLDTPEEDQGFVITRNNKIDEIALLMRAWYVSFEFKPLPVQGEYTSVLRFTAGTENNGQMGDRQPAVFLAENTTKLYICTGLNDHRSYSFTSEALPLDQWTTVVIKQEFVDSRYMYSIHINGVEVHSKHNQKPRRYENVKVYASDDFKDPANGFIRNLTYYNLTEGELFSG